MLFHPLKSLISCSPVPLGVAEFLVVNILAHTVVHKIVLQMAHASIFAASRPAMPRTVVVNDVIAKPVPKPSFKSPTKGTPPGRRCY